MIRHDLTLYRLQGLLHITVLLEHRFFQHRVANSIIRGVLGGLQPLDMVGCQHKAGRRPAFDTAEKSGLYILVQVQGSGLAGHGAGHRQLQERHSAGFPGVPGMPNGNPVQIRRVGQDIGVAAVKAEAVRSRKGIQLFLKQGQRIAAVIGVGGIEIGVERGSHRAKGDGGKPQLLIPLEKARPIRRVFVRGDGEGGFSELGNIRPVDAVARVFLIELPAAVKGLGEPVEKRIAGHKEQIHVRQQRHVGAFRPVPQAGQALFPAEGSGQTHLVGHPRVQSIFLPAR